MAMTIRDITLAPGVGGYWVQDQPAIQTGAGRDGFFFDTAPITPGFGAVREEAVAFCADIILQDGAHMLGDCVTVVNAGYAGRPAPLRAADLPRVQAMLRELYAGKTFASFQAAAELLETLPLPPEARTPIAYGISQALLAATAHAGGVTMAEVLAAEFGGPPGFAAPGFAGACEGDWYNNVDKAIVRGYAMFPHVGIQKREDIERLPDYVGWMVDRVRKLGGEGYEPDLHIDFHSMLGRVLNNDMDKVCDFIATLNQRAAPYQVYYEDPLLAGSTEEAREHLRRLRERFDRTGFSGRLIADEWANSPGQVAQFASDRAAHAIQIKMPDNGNLLNVVKAIQACHTHGVLAYLGGSVNETDISARTSAHMALALGAWRLLTKPGKGLDEGYMVMTNEIARTRLRLGAQATG